MRGGVGVISSAGLGLLYRNLSKDYIQASIMGLKEELRKARERNKGCDWRECHGCHV